MNVILSIKPKYANEIILGRKKIEFRKIVFKQEIDKVYIYSSSPEKKIVGYFTIKDIVIDTPQHMWELYKTIGSIEKIDFFNYYHGNNSAVGITILKVVKFKESLDPYKKIKNFKAPQSFMYVNGLIE